ncbi:uncharacterized protein LOC128219536 isoform X2 [Mya arenaria]|uniref:uncharacterized protein LOC128219536 isoform X2 n=1 Tax=Mya arenaria TaxID=6604 RepID=UPI0022E75C85|nr:uncharacterized protein LOC128219536 isoform X2 [Mya arenaria]
MGLLLPLIFVIGGSISIHLCLGSFYIFGNISPYMISYLKNRTSEHSLRNEDNIWIMNAATILSPVAMTLGGILDRKWGVKVACSIGCALFCSGVALSYFTIKSSLALVSLTYGMLANFGASIAYGPPAQNAAKWIPKHPTFAVGLIVCGYGGGAFIFNFVVTGFINPNNLSPDLVEAGNKKYFTQKAVLDRVPYVFLLLAGIYLAMCVIGIIAVTPPPVPGQEGCLHHLREDEELMVNQGINLMPRESALVIMLRVIKNKNAWIWMWILFLIFCGLQFANSFYKDYGQTFISDDHFLALIGSMSSIFNCLLRPVWGVIMDKYGFEFAIKWLSMIFTILSCTIMYTEKMHKIFFLLWICGMYGSYCGLWAIGPSTLGQLFGVENMAVSMGFMFVAVRFFCRSSSMAGISTPGKEFSCRRPSKVLCLLLPYSICEV